MRLIKKIAEQERGAYFCFDKNAWKMLKMNLRQHGEDLLRQVNVKSISEYSLALLLQ